MRRRRFAPLRVGGYAGSMAALFAVDRGSGEMRTAAVIDREAICDRRQTTPCVVRVDVAVQPPEYFQIIRAQVQLDDFKLNSITRTRTRARHGHGHGLFCGETPLGPCGSVSPQISPCPCPCNGI